MEDTEKEKPSDKENILYNIANADILENLETSIRPKKVRKRSSILKRKSQDGSSGEIDRGESRRSLKRKVSFASTFQILEYRTETKIVTSDNDPDMEMFSQPLPTPEQLLEPPPIPQKVSSEAKSAANCRSDTESTGVCSILKESVDHTESSLFLKDILNTDAFESSVKRARKDTCASGKARNSSLNIYTSSQSLKETTLENTILNQFGFRLSDTFAKVHVEYSDSLDGEPPAGPLENSNDDVPKQDTSGLLIDEYRGDDMFNASFLKPYGNETDSSLAEDSGVSKPSPIPNETDFRTKQTYNATIHDATNMSISMLDEKDFSVTTLPTEGHSFVVPKSRRGSIPTNKTVFCDDSMNMTCKIPLNKSSHVPSQTQGLMAGSSLKMKSDIGMIESNKTAFFDNSMDLTCKLTSRRISKSSSGDLMTDLSVVSKQDLSSAEGSTDFKQLNKTTLFDDSVDFTCKVTSGKVSALCSNSNDFIPDTSTVKKKLSAVTRESIDFFPSNKTALLDDSMDFTCKLTSTKISAPISESHDLAADSSILMEKDSSMMAKRNVNFVPSNKTALLNGSMDFTCKLTSSKSSASFSKRHELALDSSIPLERDSSVISKNDDRFVPSNKTALLDDSMDFTCKLSSSKFSALSSKKHDLMPTSPNPSIEKDSSTMSKKSINLIQSNKTALLDDSMDFMCKLPTTKISSKNDHAALSSSMMKHDVGSTLASKTLLFNDSMNFTGKLASTTSSSTSQVQFPSSGEEDVMNHAHGSLNNSNYMPIVPEGLVSKSKTSLLHLLSGSNMMSDNLCFQDVECDNGRNVVDAESVGSSTLVAPYPQSPESEVVKTVNAQTSEFRVPNKTMLFEKSVEEINTFKVPVLPNEAGCNEPRSNVSSNTISVVENLDLTSTSSNVQKHFPTLVNDDVLPDCISTGEEDNQTKSDSISLETSSDLPRSENLLMKKSETPILSEKSMEETCVQTIHILPKPSENFSILSSSKVYDATTFKIETMNLTIPNTSGYQEDESLSEENRSDHKFDDSVNNIHVPIVMSISQILNEDDHIINTTLDASTHALPEMKLAADEVLEHVEEEMTLETCSSISHDESLNEKSESSSTNLLLGDFLNYSAMVKVSKRKSSDASEYCSPPKIQHVCIPESPQSTPTSIEKPRHCPSVDLSDMPAIFTDKTTLFSKDMEITCLNQNPCLLESSDLSSKDDCDASWMHKSISLKPSNQSPDDVFNDKVKVPLYSVNGSPLCEKLALSNQADTESKGEMPSLICCDKTRRFSGEGMELTLLGNEHIVQGRPVKWLYGMTCGDETQPTLLKNGVACEQTVKEIDNTFRFNVVGMDFTCNVSTRLKLEANKILQESVPENFSVLLNSSLDADNLQQTPEISPSHSFHMTTAHDDSDEFEERCLPSAVEEKSVLRPLSDTLHLDGLSEPNSYVQSPVINHESENQTPTSHLENTQTDEVNIDAHSSRNASLSLKKNKNLNACKTFSEKANSSSPTFEALNKRKAALDSYANSPSTNVTNLSGFSEHINNSRKYSFNESRASIPYINEACLPSACHEQSESDDDDTPEVEQQLEANTFYGACKNMEDQPLDRVDAAGDLVAENSNEVPRDDVHDGDQKGSSTILGNIITAFLTESDPSPRGMKYIKNSIPNAKDLNPSEVNSKIPDSASSENSKYQPLASRTAFQGPSSMTRRTKMINIKEMLAEKRKMHQLRIDHLESAFLPHVKDDITEKGKLHQSPVNHSKSAPLVQDNVTESTSDSTDTTVVAKPKPADTNIPLHTSPDKISSHLENPTRKKPRNVSQFDILFKIKDLKKGSSQIRNAGPSNCSVLGGQILSVPLSAIGKKVQRECSVSKKILTNETCAQPTECSIPKPQTTLKDVHQHTLLLGEDGLHNEPVPSLNTTTAAENAHHNFSVPNIDMYTDYIKSSHAKSFKSDTISDSFQILSDSFLKEATFDISSFYSEKPVKPSQVVEESKTLGNFSTIVPLAHSTICEGHAVFDSSLVNNKENVMSNMTMVLEDPTAKETRKTYVIHTNAPTSPFVSESQQRESGTWAQAFATDSVFQMGNEESKYESVFMETSDSEEKANVDTEIPLSKVNIPNTKDNCTPIAEIDINTKDETLVKDHFNTDMDVSEQSVAPLHEDFIKTPKKCLDGEMSCKDEQKSFQTNLLKIATTSKFGMIDCPAKTPTVCVDRSSVIALTDHIGDDEKSCENAATVVLDTAEPEVDDPSHHVDKSFLKHSPQTISSEKLHADLPINTHKDSSFGTLFSSRDLNESSYVVMLSGMDCAKSTRVDVIPSSNSKEKTLVSNDTAKNFFQEETPFTMQLVTTAHLKEEHSKDQSLLKEVDEVVDAKLHEEHSVCETKNNDRGQGDLNKLMPEGSINFTNDPILNQEEEEEKVTLDLTQDVYKNDDEHETMNEIADVLTLNVTKANQGVITEQDVELERCSKAIFEEEPARNANQVALEKTSIETLNLPRSDIKNVVMENLVTSSCQLNKNEMSMKHGPIVVEQSENLNTSNKEELIQATCQSKWEKSGFSRTCLVEYSYSSTDESSVMMHSHEDDVCREDIPLSMAEVNDEVEGIKVEINVSNIILDVDREKRFNAEKVMENEPGYEKFNYKNMNKEEGAETVETDVINKTVDSGIPVECFDEVESNSCSRLNGKVLVSGNQENLSPDKNFIENEQEKSFITDEKVEEINDSHVQKENMEITQIISNEKHLEVHNDDVMIASIEISEQGNAISADVCSEKTEDGMCNEMEVDACSENEAEVPMECDDGHQFGLKRSDNCGVVTQTSNNEHACEKTSSEMLNDETDATIVEQQNNVKESNIIPLEHVSTDIEKQNGLKEVAFSCYEFKPDSQPLLETDSDQPNKVPLTNEQINSSVCLEGTPNTVTNKNLSAEELTMDIETPLSPTKVETFIRLTTYDEVLADVFNLRKHKNPLWNIEEVDEAKVVFSYVWDSDITLIDTFWNLRMIVKFGDDVNLEMEGSTKLVRNLHSISFESVFNETVHDAIKLSSKVFNQLLGSDNLSSLYPDSSYLLKLLSRCSKAVNKAHEFTRDVEVTLKRHPISVQGNMLEVEIISITLMSKFRLKIPTGDIHFYPHVRLIPVAVKHIFGQKINEKAIQDKVQEVAPGGHYLYNVIIAIERMKP